MKHHPLSLGLWGLTRWGPSLAVGIGMLSWLVAVVIVATLLLGGMLLLNALVQHYWPQDVRQAEASQLLPQRRRERINPTANCSS